jgi:hypothetical protein
MRILVELDGVLRGRASDPITTGVLLVGTLTAFNQIVLLSSSSTTETERWLAINKVVDYDEIVDSSAALVGEDQSRRQLDVARSKGVADMLITADPKLWRYAFDRGIACVLFGPPGQVSPEYRHDAPPKVRAWAEVEAAVEEQNVIRTKAARTQMPEGIAFGG